MQRMRVGTANGLALAKMARPDARERAIIGSGWQVGGQLMTASAVRRFDRVRVFSPRQESRDAFVAEVRLRHSDVPLLACSIAQPCLEGADVIVAAISSMVRVLEPS